MSAAPALYQAAVAAQAGAGRHVAALAHRRRQSIACIAVLAGAPRADQLEGQMVHAELIYCSMRPRACTKARPHNTYYSICVTDS